MRYRDEFELRYKHKFIPAIVLAVLVVGFLIILFIIKQSPSVEEEEINSFKDETSIALEDCYGFNFVGTITAQDVTGLSESIIGEFLPSSFYIKGFITPSVISYDIYADKNSENPITSVLINSNGSFVDVSNYYLYSDKLVALNNIENLYTQRLAGTQFVKIDSVDDTGETIIEYLKEVSSYIKDVGYEGNIYESEINTNEIEGNNIIFNFFKLSGEKLVLSMETGGKYSKRTYEISIEGDNIISSFEFSEKIDVVTSEEVYYISQEELLQMVDSIVAESVPTTEATTVEEQPVE